MCLRKWCKITSLHILTHYFSPLNAALSIQKIIRNQFQPVSANVFFVALVSVKRRNTNGGFELAGGIERQPDCLPPQQAPEPPLPSFTFEILTITLWHK
jgi:hypothetical protein